MSSAIETDESATAVTATTSSSSSVILACEIPNNASVGQSFHVKSPDGRYFEVQVPANVSPGDTIHIVIPQSAPDTSVTATAAAATTSTSTVTTNAPTPKEMREYYQKQEDEANNANAAAVTPDNNQTKGIGLNNVFNSLSVGITSGLTVVCDTAKEFDQKYKLSDKINEIHEKVTLNSKIIDEKYKITDRLTTTSSNIEQSVKNINEKYDLSTKATSIINTTATKVKEFDENYKVSEKFSEKLTQFYTFAVQIDEKYAISPTAGRIITASSEAVKKAYNSAIEYEREKKIIDNTTESVKGVLGSLSVHVNNIYDSIAAKMNKKKGVDSGVNTDVTMLDRTEDRTENIESSTTIIEANPSESSSSV